MKTGFQIGGAGSSTCRAWFLVLIMGSLGSLRSEPVRVAIVSDPLFSNTETELTSLVSKIPRVALLERSAWEPLAREQALASGGLSLRKSINLGHLAGATGLIVLRPASPGSADAAIVTILSVKTGVILWSDLLDPKNIPSVVPATLESLLDRLGANPEKLTWLSLVPTEAASKTDIQAQDWLQIQLILTLGRNPGLLILERQRMEPILDESFFTGPDAPAIHKRKIVIEVKVGRDPLNNTKFSAVFRLSPPSGVPQVWTISADSVEALLEPALREISSRIKVDIKQEGAPDERAIFTERFRRMERKGSDSLPEHRALGEIATTLFALGDRQPLVWQYYANRALFDADNTDIRGIKDLASSRDPAADLRRLARAATVSLELERDRVKQLAGQKRDFSHEVDLESRLRWKSICLLETAAELKLPLREDPFRSLQSALREMAQAMIESGIKPPAGFLSDARYWGLPPADLVAFYNKAVIEGDYSSSNTYQVRNLQSWIVNLSPLWWSAENSTQEEAGFNRLMAAELLVWKQSDVLAARLASLEILKKRFETPIDGNTLQTVLIDDLPKIQEQGRRGSALDLDEWLSWFIRQNATDRHQLGLVEHSIALIETATHSEQIKPLGFPLDRPQAERIWKALRDASRRLGSEVQPDYQKRLVQKFSLSAAAAPSVVTFGHLWPSSKLPGSPSLQVKALPTFEEGRAFFLLQDTRSVAEPWKLLTLELPYGKSAWQSLPANLQNSSVEHRQIWLTKEAIHVGPFRTEDEEGWAYFARPGGPWQWFARTSPRAIAKPAIIASGNRIFCTYNPEFPQPQFGIVAIDVASQKSEFFSWKKFEATAMTTRWCEDLELSHDGRFLYPTRIAAKSATLRPAFDMVSKSWSEVTLELGRDFPGREWLPFRLSDAAARNNGRNPSNSIPRCKRNREHNRWQVTGINPITDEMVDFTCNFSKVLGPVGEEEKDVLEILGENNSLINASFSFEGVLITLRADGGDGHPWIFFAPWSAIPRPVPASLPSFLVDTDYGVALADSHLTALKQVMPGASASQIQLSSNGTIALSCFSPVGLWLAGPPSQTLERWTTVSTDTSDRMFLGNNGKRVWRLDRAGSLSVVDLASGNSTLLGSHPKSSRWSLSVSPDEKRISLFTKTELILLDEGCREVARFRLPSAVQPHESSWSHDGIRLFVGGRGASSAILRVDGPECIVEKVIPSVLAFAWSAKSPNYFVMSKDNNKKYQLAAGAATGETERTLIAGLSSSGSQIIPDEKRGRLLATVKFDSSADHAVVEYDLNANTYKLNGGNKPLANLEAFE